MLLKTTINLLTNYWPTSKISTLPTFPHEPVTPKPTATVNYRLHFVWNYLDENTVSFNDLNVLHSRKLILSLSKGWIYAEKTRRNDFIESTTFTQVLIPKKSLSWCLLLHGLVGVSLKGVSICCFNSPEYLTSNLNKRKVAVMFPYSDCLLTSVDVIV